MSKTIVYILLAASLGLNAGVIATTLIQQKSSPPVDAPPGPRGDRGPQHGPPDPARLVENHVRGITRHLALDPEQQQAVRAVLENHAPELVRRQTDVAEANRRLSVAFAEPVFDPELFRQLTLEASAARARLDSLSAAMLVAEAALLTPEQRREYAKVAPSIHSQPRRPPRQGGPPPR